MNDILNILGHFNRRAATYDANATWVSDPVILSAVFSMLGPIDGPLSVLDVGVGTGVLSEYLIRSGGGLLDVRGVDISEAMLAQCRQRGVEATVGYADCLPFDDAIFDRTVSRQCLHYVADLSAAFSEIRRVLRSDGVFVLAQIVPASDELTAEWASITRMRQPLRANYLSASGWASVAESAELSLIEERSIVQRGSTSGWSKKYFIEDPRYILKYRDVLKQSSSEYQAMYDIETRGDQCYYNVYWIIQRYSISASGIEG